ncbi:unnamed protein product [Alopecurus aequalis]
MMRDQPAGAAAMVVHEKVKLYIGVLTVQFLYAGFHIVSRAALNMGISKIVYIVYRNLISLALLSPFAYLLERNDRPPLTISLLLEFSVQALLGITANQGLYMLGLYYLSPTYASAIQNTVPAITFLLAAVLGLEQVELRRRHGLAKVIGTVVSIGGATVITLYKGLPLLTLQSLVPLTSSSSIYNWTLGCIFMAGNCLSWSAWMVLQVPLLRRYPARLSVISLTCFFGLLQFLVIAAFTEEDHDRWKVNSLAELFTILYAGVVHAGVAFALQIWCIQKGGPLFTAIFQPVQTVLVAVMAAIFLGDQLYTGGIIGAVLIVIGLYFVLWGKNDEEKAKDQDVRTHLLGQDAPANG